MSQSQQIGGKGIFDHHRKDDNKPILDPFKSSPDRFRRRGTINSSEGKPQQHLQINNPITADDDELPVVSSSTVDPMPINKGGRCDSTRKPSPRQGVVSGSLPSIHKQSGNSDLMRVSVNRSSPSHNYSRHNPYKHLLINPCNPSDNQNLWTSHLRRWQHALPKMEENDGPIVHWKSLTTPACLPLTTDYFPSQEELAKLYSHYMYTVSASEDTNLYQAGDRNLSEHKKTENLLIEMLSQRLAQGFQIIVDNLSGSYKSKEGFILGKDELESNGSPISVGGGGEKKWKNMVWWLSMGHQVHQLTFDSSGQNVEVRRYVRMVNFDIEKMAYKCVIWPKNMPTYRSKNVSFSYPSLMYQWNYLDHLVAGYQDELTDNLRFWRTRFIIIPRETLPTNITLTGALHDHLDEEEKRIALFESWIQSIRRAKWLTPEEREELQKKRKKEIGFSDLGIKLTTMDPSAYVASDSIRASITSPAPGSKSFFNIGQALTRDSRSKDFALAMQEPKTGVKIMDRRWHFRMFNNVFTGTEMVDWLIVQIEDITTREQAVQFGNTLMQRKPPLFVSATKRHSLLDGNYFYSLHEEFNVDKKKLSKPPQKPTSTDNSLRQVPSTQSNGSFKSVEFEMSKSMIIDVDPYKKSDRRETAILHYDTIHNPNNCYHFQLNWLGCTAQLVQELLQNWSRQAERCGLKLVEGSVDQAFEDSENNNPFQCPVPIPMAVPPPPVSELISVSHIDVPDQFYEIALVRHLEFVLDVEADHNFERASEKGVDLEYSYIKETFKYDQYIHRSGVSFVQIRPEGKGFYWVNNRLYTNHTPALIANRRQPTSQLCHPDALRIKFQESCSDAKWLTEFWNKTKNHFLEGVKPHGTDAWVFENSETIVETDVPEEINTLGKTNSHKSDVTVTISPASPPKNNEIMSQSFSSHHHQGSGSQDSSIV